MRVVIAPDSFGGTLSPLEAADAIASGWQGARPGDEVVRLPMSDGGEGLLVAVEASLASRDIPVERRTVEVADPRGLATDAAFLLLDDGQTALVESARACGLALVPEDSRDPRRTTTWGVGQLVAGAAEAGASRLLVGLGGSSTVDGGAGALSGMGFRVTVADGSGLKVGGEDLPRVAAIAEGWIPDSVRRLEQVVLLADVRAVLADAARVYGPQKGADEAAVAHLAGALDTWADVVEDAFGAQGLRHVPGTGSAGGLGFGLAAALRGTLVHGAREVASLVGLADALDGADLVLTGEGRLDLTSLDGKVVGTVAETATSVGARIGVVAGQVDAAVGTSGRVDGWLVEQASTAGGTVATAADVASSASKLAGRLA